MFSRFRKGRDSGRAAEPTFKERVESFWCWYATVADRFYQTIEAGRCADLAREVSSGIDEHLSHFSWVFGPGANGSGHSLTLTAEGNRYRQFLTQYCVSCAPELTGWTFYPARQPGRIRGIVLTQGEERFDPAEIWITPWVDEQRERIELTAWHPHFDRLPEKDSYLVIYLFLDEALGEYGTQRWIGKVTLAKNRLAQSMAFRELPEYVAGVQAQKGWRMLEPGECSTSYRLNQDDRRTPRGDTIAGSSELFDLIDAFLGNEGPIKDPFAGTGAEAVYVAFPSAFLPEGRQVEARGVIEDALEARLRSQSSGRLIGRAFGRQAAYIDLLLFDGHRSVDLVIEVLREQGLPCETSIHPFTSGKPSAGIKLG